MNLQGEEEQKGLTGSNGSGENLEKETAGWALGLAEP